VGVGAGYDPPIAFGTRGTALPAPASVDMSLDGIQDGPAPVALAGRTAFVATGAGLTAIDASTGRTIANVAPVDTVVSPPDSGSGAGGAAPPAVVADLAGRETVLVGYVVQQPGHGTASPSLAVEVDVLDARTADRLSVIVAPVPGEPSDLSGSPSVTVLGEVDGVVVLSEGDSDDGYLTEAINLVDRKVLWQNQTFLGDVIAGTAVVGTRDSSGALGQGANGGTFGVRLAGLDLRTGRRLWLGLGDLSDAQVVAGGGEEVLLNSGHFSTGGYVVAMVDAQNGSARTLTTGESPFETTPWTCVSDGVATDVCSADAEQTVAVAFDATTGRVLWQLPDKATDRVAPTVTDAWHGVVYGTTASGPVVLDARTGQDRNDSPGVAPIVVDGYAAVAGGAQNGLEAYPAIR
jgi:hypothetical protein